MSVPTLGPGVWVEVIRSRGTDPRFFLGRVLQCEEITEPRPCDAYHECPGISFAGIEPPYLGGWWASCCVRPIYRPNQEIIESLKQPAPAGVRELEDA
jgi:hypothetical protein